MGAFAADEAYYTVAGSETLCGSNWNPEDSNNQMIPNAEGLYEKYYENVPAGTHECKITNGSWDANWGDNGEPGGANYTFTTEEAHDVTIIFNPETLEIGHILAEATEPTTPVVPVEYPITVKVHYYRADAAYSDWEVHMWNGSGAATVSSTREFELEDVEYEGTTYGATATCYTNSNETWVGFIVKKPDWTKDPDGDRKIDISDVLSGTVHVYAKTGSALEDFDVVKDECVKGAKIIGAKWDSLTGILTVTTSMAIEGDLMEAFTLEGPDGEIEITNVIEVGRVDEKSDATEYVVEYAEGAITNDKAYKVHFNGASCDVTIPNTYSAKEFETEYTYTGDDLGATWSAESTTFRVWAPTAAAVSVNLYTSGAAGTDDKTDSIEMTKDVNGTWVVTVDGDLNGVYYTYSVNVQGKVAEAVDCMVDLGVNYVHLLPVYDINSVDETTGGYNWGYDPKNYNVPEGSYSTDPYNGAVRVTEFKQMVLALHENGIGVIMDVVYNHVADAGNFCFNQITAAFSPPPTRALSPASKICMLTKMVMWMALAAISTVGAAVLVTGRKKWMNI